MQKVRSKVVLLWCERYNEDLIYEKIKYGIELLGGFKSIFKEGEKILLKPNNLTSATIEEAVTTHPAVFGAACRLVKDNNFEAFYGDSPSRENPVQSLRKNGFTEVANRYNVPLADFEHGKKIVFNDGKVCKSFDIVNAIFDTDAIISLSKMKTHAFTRITGAIKNQFGCVLGFNKGVFHVKYPDASQFSRMLVDLNRYLKPRLFIMDAIVAMEGNGPRSGKPRKVNCILISKDPVALDSVFCRIINLEPAFVATIRYGKQDGLGTFHENEIELLGDPLELFYCKDFDVERKPIVSKTKRSLNIFKKVKVNENHYPRIDETVCIKCGICVDSCPLEKKALSFKNGKNNIPVYDYSLCIRCFCCQENCPQKAIK
ncbi:MAG TPA: DUF362 domain-containing protein [Exilispira sp.]|nr:DUF362 domain-containing protein [Exilispira sp.]